MLKPLSSRTQNLDEVVPRQYDFIYLRFDFQSGSNCGFGFVNFITLEALLKFWSARLGTMWDKDNSRKLVMGGFANIQVTPPPFGSPLDRSHSCTSSEISDVANAFHRASGLSSRGSGTHPSWTRHPSTQRRGLRFNLAQRLRTDFCWR